MRNGECNVILFFFVELTCLKSSQNKIYFKFFQRLLQCQKIKNSLVNKFHSRKQKCFNKSNHFIQKKSKKLKIMRMMCFYCEKRAEKEEVKNIIQIRILFIEFSIR